jgi:hypothetical protein
VDERGTDGKIPEPKTFAVPASKNGMVAQGAAARKTVGAAEQTLASASQTISEASRTLGVADGRSVPLPPASVAAADMADVEALARRIEADYDRRQVETASAQLRAGVMALPASRRLCLPQICNHR